MALLTTINQIDIYSNQAGILSGVTPTSPIEGSGSLRTWRNTAATFTMHAARNTAPYRFGSGYGYLRWKLDTALPDGLRLGYYCCASQADISGTTGVAYSAWIFRDSFSGGRFVLWLTTFAGGLTGTEGAGTSVNITPLYNTLDVVYTLAMTWVYDARYGGLLLNAWLEPGTTLPDRETQAPRLSYLFPLASAPTSFGEGEWCRLVSSGANTGVVTDQVGRYALLITG
jgi:hypothetical protein